MRKRKTFLKKIHFLSRFQKQPDPAEEKSVVSTTLSIPFAGSKDNVFYFTGNPDFTAPDNNISSSRFRGSRIFLYSSDPEHDLPTVPDSLFEMLHRYFAVHSPDDVICWKDGVLSFQTAGNCVLSDISLPTSDDTTSKIIPFPSFPERQRILQ